jgi:hypothetical protein
MKDTDEYNYLCVVYKCIMFCSDPFWALVSSNPDWRPSNTSYGIDNDYYRYQQPLGSCQVTVADTLMECSTNIGTGSNLQWRLQVGGVNTTSGSVRGSYQPANVTALLPLQTYDIVGGEVFTIIGTNFGTTANQLINVSYGPVTGMEYNAINCSVLVNHTQIVCYTNKGVGGGLRFRVNITNCAGLLSIPLLNYKAPLINDVRPLFYTMPTAEPGGIITIYGDYFGMCTVSFILLFVLIDLIFRPFSLSFMFHPTMMHTQ